MRQRCRLDSAALARSNRAQEGPASGRMERSVFVSYARADSAHVYYDAELLRAGGVRVFIDVRDIEYGERWRDVLTRALQTCERVLVFWSEAARVSEWVEREWRLALELGKKIVPTLLDSTPLPAELAEFQCIKRGKPMFSRRLDAPFGQASPEPPDLAQEDFASYSKDLEASPSLRRWRRPTVWLGAVAVSVTGIMVATLLAQRPGIDSHQVPPVAASAASGPASAVASAPFLIWLGFLLVVILMLLTLVSWLVVISRGQIKRHERHVDIDLKPPASPPPIDLRELISREEAEAFVAEVFSA